LPARISRGGEEGVVDREGEGRGERERERERAREK